MKLYLLLVAALITAAQSQLFSGKITNFLDFLRPRRIPAQRHFVRANQHNQHNQHNPLNPLNPLNPQHKHRRAQHTRPARKAIRPNYPKTVEDQFAQAPVLKHYQPIAPPPDEPPKTTNTTTTLPTGKPSSTPYPIILITSRQAAPSTHNPPTSDWHPLYHHEYPALTEAVTPVKIQKNLVQGTTDQGKDDLGLVSQFSLFIRPDQPASSSQDEATEARETAGHDHAALDSFYAPVSATIARQNEYAVTEDTIEQENDNYNEYAEHPMNLNAYDLGEKHMPLEMIDYDTTILTEYSEEVEDAAAMNDDTHKPYYVKIKDYSDDYPANSPGKLNNINELYEAGNNDIIVDEDKEHIMQNKEDAEMDQKPEAARNEEYDEPVSDNVEAEEYSVKDNQLNPQFKTDYANAEYPMNMNAEDLGGAMDYVTTYHPDYSININVDNAKGNVPHKPFPVEVKNYNDEAIDVYQPTYSNSHSPEELTNNEIYEVVTNDIVSDEDMELEHIMQNEGSVDMYEKPKTTSDLSIYPIDENDEPLEENDQADKDNMNENDINPQFKNDITNSNFKTDFFHSENIQNLVFSIPEQFRTFLQEPPDWINKDYW